MTSASRSRAIFLPSLLLVKDTSRMVISYLKFYHNYSHLPPNRDLIQQPMSREISICQNSPTEGGENWSNEAPTFASAFAHNLPSY